MEKHPLHLKIPELQKSEEVSKAVEKKERLEDTDIPNNPNERIEAYMDRLEKIFLNQDQRVRERNLEMVKDKIYDALIIKPEEVPESYFDLQKQIARERGQTVEEIPEEAREQMIETIVKDQKHSLDQWVEYLTSDDAAYPTWFKYFVFRNITKLSQFDKTLGKFKDRTATTTAPYPDIYRAPLAKILDIYEESVKNKKSEAEIKEQFSKSFPKLYAGLISESLAHQIENQEEVRGEWVKYNQGNQKEADKLFDSMQTKGTGWCIEGQTTARNYINRGDFYVYYTYDANNEPTQPRIAIQMTSSQIGQVRGILQHQEMEPVMAPVLEEKLKEFGSEADSYKKKTEDMKKMTEIENKTKTNQPLTKEELVFLYEINEKIEGFGYENDPRIQEIRDQRNSKEDAPVVLDCKPEEIATSESEITQNTKAYIGELFPGVFKTNIENIFTSFPEGKIQRYETQIGNKTKEELIRKLKEKNIYISDYAKDLLNSQDFKTSETQEDLNLVRLTVKDLGFPNGATTDEIYKRAEDFGLELCPAEVGPQLRLSYSETGWMFIAMKQISDRDGYPDVFHLRCVGDWLRMSTGDAAPSCRWNSHDPFLFCSRKS
ncbi:MAG: hypothetical protein V1896_02840 [Candidatus Zambryskibacteria bacterium]